MTSKSNFEILDWAETELGVLCLRRRELLSQPGTIVTDVTLDHEMLMSSHLTLSERSLARRALEMHSGHGLCVLIGGLGLGYTAREVLVAGEDRIARVEVVEYLEPVIRWIERDLVPTASALREDPRIEIVRGDVYARLSAAGTGLYDLILIDVDHSPEERLGSESAAFYEEAGLRSARRHLADGGILGIWSYAPDPRLAASLRSVFDAVEIESVTVVNDLVDEEQTDWLYFARK